MTMTFTHLFQKSGYQPQVTCDTTTQLDQDTAQPERTALKYAKMQALTLT